MAAIVVVGVATARSAGIAAVLAGTACPWASCPGGTGNILAGVLGVPG